jgi:hypothetical protein
MSTQPPPPTQTYDRPYYGAPMPPLPSLNGELIVFVLIWVVVLIVTLAADEVTWNEFVLATVIAGSFYILSRGIAKAGKVLEGR